MTDDIEEDSKGSISDVENTYQTSEVAKMLGMAPTTVRKYSQSLVEQGYTFLLGAGTGHRQARLFTDKDITVLRYLKEIREETNITVERATSVVIERFGKGTTQSTLPSNQANTNELVRYEERHDEMKEMIQDLTTKLDKQDQTFDRILEELDEIKQLNERLEKRGFFKRLFGK